MSRVRVPWGLLVLLVLIGDGASLWWLYAAAREAGNGVATSTAAVMGFALLSLIVGSAVLRRAGAGSLRALRGGVPPDRVDKALLDGLLVLVAAVLVMIPGLVSDAVALLLLFPLTRAPLRALVRKRAVVAPGGRGVFVGRAAGFPRRERREADGPVDVEPEDYRVE